nr:TPM domain-containing protein [Pontixanthobacter sp. CEM42]
MVACNAQEVETETAIEPPTGPVVDTANIIPAEVEDALDSRLRNYFTDSGTAIVVSTVPTLSGQPIEDVARTTFNEWGIGNPDTHRGLLMLIAVNDRQLRIEVGCGLEKPVTNAAAQTVVTDTIIPFFKSGDFTGGINAGVIDLITLLDNATEFGPITPYCTKLMQDAA